MAGFKGFEFAGQVLTSRRPQFRDECRILCGEPVLKFVQRLDGRENGGGDFNGFHFHGHSLSRFAGKGRIFPFHAMECGEGGRGTAGGAGSNSALMVRKMKICKDPCFH